LTVSYYIESTRGKQVAVSLPVKLEPVHTSETLESSDISMNTLKMRLEISKPTDPLSEFTAAVGTDCFYGAEESVVTWYATGGDGNAH